MLRCRSAVIDGEVVEIDAAGRSDFHAVKSVIALGGRGLVFIAFDLLFLARARRGRESSSRRRRAAPCNGQFYCRSKRGRALGCAGMAP
jgi:ATP-dependent DNA ligase